MFGKKWNHKGKNQNYHGKGGDKKSQNQKTEQIDADEEILQKLQEELDPENAMLEEEDDQEAAHRQGFSDFIYKNIFFEWFYRHQLKTHIGTDEAFANFMNTVRNKLPVAFRLNKSSLNFPVIQAKLNDLDYMKRNFFDIEGVKLEEIKDIIEKNKELAKHSVDFSNIVLERVNWFPDHLAYVMNLTRDNIRKNPGLKKLQRFINACSDAGLLTRQELVSMLPPIFLDIKPSDMVLDVCAAPGSKTSQMLERVLSESKEQELYKMTGGVVANDADSKRAFMLTHQLQRIDTTGMLVINHEGQHIPTIRREGIAHGLEDRYFFDKILADVPCSGDGAIRKLPLKWRGWSTKDGMSLHYVQVQILERSLQLVKEGGLVAYSTCSLSPIENESVVADVVHRANLENPGCVEVVDIHNKFPGLIGRRGITSWDVLVEKPDMKIHKSEDSTQYKPEQLFHFLKKYDESTCNELCSLIRRKIPFIYSFDVSS
jgi:multisite-specific tRNA:(cytosine-C5)-methyltransferase